jgi:hypothetical protein
MNSSDPSAMPPSPHDHVIFTDLGDGAGVLVDLDSKQYFQLNETATVIWRALAGCRALEEISRELTDRYEVTPEHARASVETAIRDFTAYRLLKKPR